MNLKIGIVGLPNVGKSTLFNALTRSNKAAAANFPFCTIDPNIGIVEVPDKRLYKLAEIAKPLKIVPSVVEFVDIAGLVRGASKGEGLGNKFLSHIRECNAICHVLRAFQDSEVHHVEGIVDPASDFEVIKTELALADLQSVDKQLSNTEKKAKSGDKEAKLDFVILQRIKVELEKGTLVHELSFSEEESVSVKRFQLLTAKKFLVVANVAENEFANFDEKMFRSKISADANIPIIPVCAKIEAELASLSEEEAKEFLLDLGATASGLENLGKKSFEVLELQNYFTAGPQEVRSWTTHKGATAPEAAGEIHTDFQKGFIKAEVIAYEDFITCSGEAGAKEKGKLRIEGKEYIVKDGDVMHFRFSL